MKKTIIFAIIAFLLVGSVVILPSCFGPSSVGYKSLLYKKTATSDLDSYTSVSQVDELTGATVANTHNDLVYLTGTADSEDSGYPYTKHIVYNLKTDSILYSKAESDSLDINVELYGTSDTVRFSFFAVKTSETETEDDGTTSTDYYTRLYDDKGELFASTKKTLTPSVAEDLIYFNERCFRADKNGKIKSAFDFSALAQFPSIDCRSKNYYYDISIVPGNTYIETYSKKLEFLSRYDMPNYAHLNSYAVLDNGDILVQYVYEEDAESDDYTFLLSSDEVTKYTMKTLIIDAKTGKEKNIKCNYYLNSYINNTSLYAPENLSTGLDVKKYSLIGYGYSIKDKRLNVSNSSEKMLFINGSGKVSELDSYNGDSIFTVYSISDDRWILSTTSDKDLLVRSGGKIVGDISNAQRAFGDYFIFNETIYDDDLKAVYDFKKDDLTVKEFLDGAILFENEDGEILLYTGEDKSSTLIAKESSRSLVHFTSYFFVIRDDSESSTVFEVYDGAGNKIATLDNLSSSATFTAEHAIDGSLLISTYNSELESVFFCCSGAKK